MKNSDRWFIFYEQQLFLMSNQLTYAPPTYADIANYIDKFSDYHALGEEDGLNLFCTEVKALHPDLPTALWMPFKQALNQMEPCWVNPAAKAAQFLHWQKQTKFCGSCGNGSIQQTDILERTCSACGVLYYPRISPSVIVMIRKENQVLMTRSHHFPPGAYGLVAGFIEPGETAEEAVHREAKEEVNITLKNLRYYGSQPWPFPDSLMFAYTADYAGGELIIDTNEIETAGWYTADNIPGFPSSSISIARTLMEQFIAETNFSK